MELLARALPTFLRNQLVLPLREGSDFVAWAIKAKGRDGLNALYANPPSSTAQILHPEKYYLTPQPPQRFFPAGLLRHMAVPTLFEQSLGEFLLRGLLETENSLALSSQIAAAGWRGDQLFAFAGKSIQTTAWYRSWGSPGQMFGSVSNQVAEFGSAGVPAKMMKRCLPTPATAAAARSRGTTTSWSILLVAPTGWPPLPRQRGKI